jgi:hypothetical protein
MEVPNKLGNVRFCNGPWCQVTRLGSGGAGYLLLSVVGLELPHDTIRGSSGPIFPASSARQRLRTLRLHHFLHVSSIRNWRKRRSGATLRS